jgi:hypothetical protein
MEDAITSADVGEESVSQALTFGGTLHQTGNVHDVQKSGNFAGKEMGRKENSLHRYLSPGDKC